MSIPDTTQIPLLPDELTLKYVAEGAANVIWRVSLPSQPSSAVDTPPPTVLESYSSTTPPPTELDPFDTDPSYYNNTTSIDYTNLLLRLRKNLPSSEENLLAYQYLSNVISLLFPPGLIVGQTLVRVSQSLISRANDILHDMETKHERVAPRAGLFLAGDPREKGQYIPEPYAFLLEDMTPSVGDGEFLLEFKAKWVVQSPSAPVGWKRCRTCALRLKKAAKAMRKGKDVDKVGWKGMCPFDLASDDQKRVEKAVLHIIDGNDEGERQKADPALVTRIAESLMRGPQLKILKQRQAEFDPYGILKADRRSKSFLTAMTLRDCTFYVKVSASDVQARLGDFDVKSIEGGKEDYWVQLEEELIREGWYTATEEGEYPWKAEGMQVLCQAY